MMLARFKQNRIPIHLTTQLVLGLIQELRERLRGNNESSPDSKGTAIEALDNLASIVSEAKEMAEIPSDELEDDQQLQSWSKKFKTTLDENITNTFAAENLANAAVPTGVILGCGALGALIGGPVGFGAGSVLGHLITGQIKPGAAAQKIEKSLSTHQDEPPADQ